MLGRPGAGLQEITIFVAGDHAVIGAVAGDKGIGIAIAGLDHVIGTIAALNADCIGIASQNGSLRLRLLSW